MLIVAIIMLAFVLGAVGQQNPTTSATGSFIVNGTGDSAVVTFVAPSSFKSEWPGQVGLVTMSFTTDIFASESGRVCGNDCAWSRGLPATFYDLVKSNNNLKSFGPGIVPSSCRLFPRPSFSSISDLKNTCLKPRENNNNFAVRFKGFVYIATAGVWTFFLQSDDGSRLFIEQSAGPKLVVNNWRDGVFPQNEMSGTCDFSRIGWHGITIEYYQENYNFGLEILWERAQTPGQTVRSPIPSSAFAPSNNMQSPLVLASFNSVSSTTNAMPRITITMTGLTFARYPVHTNDVFVTFQTNFDNSPSEPLWIAASVSVVNSTLHSLPASGTSSVTVSGSGFVLYAPGGPTARVALGRPAERGTNCQASRWQSATSIICKSPWRASGNGLNVIVSQGSFWGFSGSMSTASVYSAPLTFNSSSQRLSNITITGSNYGPFLAVVLSSTSCGNLSLPARTNQTICSSSDLEGRDPSLTITDAAVSIAFSNAVRLDDVTVLLRSPQGTDFKLMRSKCFGAPQTCSAGNSLSFNFQILPTAAFQSVPLVLCSSSGTYTPDDVDLLRAAFSLQSAKGRWTLLVVTGSQAQNISSASLTFKTENLGFRVGNLPVTTIDWVSDSSATMNAPGYQISGKLESSSGFGRNHPVTALASGIKSPSLCNYSYPDPVMTNTSASAAYGASGSYAVQLVGRYFSNTNSSDPRARMGSSTCAATLWLSDTALTCVQSPSLGSIRIFAVSMQRSSVANFTSILPFAHEQSISANPVSNYAITAHSAVTLFGGGFALWDLSARVRLVNGVSLSSSGSTIWCCESSLSTKVSVVTREVAGLVISLQSVARMLSVANLPELLPSTISNVEKFNVPSTGASVVRLAGARFGSYDASLKISMGMSRCLESRWTSDSSIQCKAPSGIPNLMNSSPLFATVFVAWSNGSGPSLSFDAPFVNGSADAISNNSVACFFNSFGACLSGRLIQFVNSSRGFGTSSFPPRTVKLVQGSQSKSCDNTSWISDSSVYCLYSAVISPEFRFLQVYVDPIPSQLNIKNPFYLPAPPSLSSETVQLRFYQKVAYPDGEDKGFQLFGTTSGFDWSESSLDSSALYSQVMTFSFLIFIRASQSFLDSSFSPISTNISGLVTVWSTSDVTSMTLCDKVASKGISFTLPPQLFWAKANLSLAFCAPKSLNGQSLRLRADVNIRNSNGTLSLSAFSPAFFVNSSGTASITFRSEPSSQVVAAKVHSGLLSFRFNFGSLLDDVCERDGVALFKFSVSLLCGGQMSNFRSSLASMGAYIESMQCLQSVSAISFIRPAKQCVFSVSVITDGIISQNSSFFEVVPGDAKMASLVGSGPFCASAGAIVWSQNSTSDGLCLVAQLQDAEGNDITSAVNATVIARNVNSSEPDYQVARRSSNISSTSGLIRWCDAYSSKTQNTGIVFGARVNENVTYWTSSVINVSSSGLASNLVPMKTDFLNQTLLAGASPQKLSFFIQDAGQNSYQGPRLAIRVRVVPRVNATTSRSLSSILVASKERKRRLLQSSNVSSEACASDATLEFIFPQTSSSPEITAGPEFLCRAGVNDVFFDIGTYDAASFSSTGLNVFTMDLTVNYGDFKSFVLVDAYKQVIAQTYRLIDFLEVMFLDAGLNEVSGNATMSLVCINTSVFVHSAEPFTVVSNGNIKAFAPPFFLFVRDWHPSMSPLMIGLTTANSSIPQYGPKFVTVQLNWTCSPGSRVPSLSPVEIFAKLILINKTFDSGAFPECVKCSNGTISNHFDAQTCR